METQTRQTIEERVKIAEQELVRAQENLAGCEKIRKKKDLLKSKFGDLMKRTDLEIRQENNPTQYGVTSWGGFGQGNCLPLGKQDSALNVLYGFLGGDINSLFKSHDMGLYGRIRDSMNKYVEKIWDRTITEQEYNSIIDATEPFIGRYIQRVYDVRQQKAEAFQRSVEKENAQYRKITCATHKTTSSETPVPKTLTQHSIVKSLLNLLFGGGK